MKRHLIVLALAVPFTVMGAGAASAHTRAPVVASSHHGHGVHKVARGHARAGGRINGVRHRRGQHHKHPAAGHSLPTGRNKAPAAGACPTHCVPKPPRPAGGWLCVKTHTCKPPKPHCPPVKRHPKPPKSGHPRPVIHPKPSAPQPIRATPVADAAALPFTGFDPTPVEVGALLVVAGFGLIRVGRKARVR